MMSQPHDIVSKKKFKYSIQVYLESESTTMKMHKKLPVIAIFVAMVTKFPLPENWFVDL